MRQREKIFTKLAFATAIILVAVTFCSFFSFHYFRFYAYIHSFDDFLFALFNWLKLAGIATAAGAIFLKSKRLSNALKYLYIILPLITLFWLKKFASQQIAPRDDFEWIYFYINDIMPLALVKTLYVLEAVLLSLCAVFVAIRDYKKREIRVELGSLKWFLVVFFFTMPLNLLENIERNLPNSLYKFLQFKSFTYVHLFVFAALMGCTYLTYRLLKDKDKQQKWRYLSMLAMVLLLQYMSRASMLMGDGYNCYYTIIAFVPLFVCTLGVLTACFSIFTRKKTLSDISFFVHAPGALSIFFYFGKEEMSQFGTIFDFSALYFSFMHGVLFVISVMPIFLRLHTFSLKKCIVPLVYYALFILTAALMSEVVSSSVFSYGETAVRIFPNFSFTQESPIPIDLPLVPLRLFGFEFNILYLALLFLVYTSIFFVFYLVYHFTFERYFKKNPVPTEGRSA